MREFRSYGSVRGVRSNPYPYRDYATGGIGSIESRGLRRDGDAYVNDAYSKSSPTIKLNVEGGIGQIILDLER